MKSPSRALLIFALFLTAALSGCAGKAKGANEAPTGKLAVTATDNPLVWTLDGSQSIDPNGDALTYAWNWVLGATETTESKIQVEFPPEAAAGSASYFVSLTVRDPDGLSSLDVNAISFGNGINAPPVIGINEVPRWVKPNTEIILDASATTDPDGDPMAYEWTWGALGKYDSKAKGVADPCLESDDRLATFSTGCLEQGQSHNVTFDQAGFWDIHCHPHPWMTARIVVDASQPASNIVYKISNFGYPNQTTIGVGSTVTFVNEDPVAHTATVLDWLPATKSGGDTPMFKETPPAGDYAVRLIVTDAKGGRATKTWGLKVSDDAPLNPYTVEKSEPGSPVPCTDAGNTCGADVPYNLTYDASIKAVLTWNGQLPNLRGNFSVGTKKDDGSYSPNPSCQAHSEQGLAGEPPEMIMLCILKGNGDLPTQKPAQWVFRIIGGSSKEDPGVLADWTFTVTGMVRTKPGFGDSATCVMHAGHCH